MKRNLTKSTLFAVFIMGVNACSNPSSPVDKTKENTDTSIHALSHEVLNIPFTAISPEKVFDVPIPETLAQECVDEYCKIFSNPTDLTAIKKAYTDYTQFNAAKVINWVNGPDVSPQSKYLVIKFGVYTKHVIDSLNKIPDPSYKIDPSKVGRLTVFIFPMDDSNGPLKSSVKADGTVSKPYNIGSIHP